MANAILTRIISGAAFDIDIAAVPNAHARSASYVNNSGLYPAAIVSVQVTAGANAPTVNTAYDYYLLRWNDQGKGTDGTNLVKSGWTPQNAVPLGSIVVSGVANMIYVAEFDTAPLGPLGEFWSVGLKNTTGQAAHSTPSNHYIRFSYYYPEVQ